MEECLGCFLYDTKVPLKLKKFFYLTAVRPVMLNGTECLVVENHNENKCSGNREVVLDVL